MGYVCGERREATDEDRDSPVLGELALTASVAQRSSPSNVWCPCAGNTGGVTTSDDAGRLMNARQLEILRAMYADLDGWRARSRGQVPGSGVSPVILRRG